MTRLMCSQDRAEVESVKKELFRAGIASEVRSNPLADALRVTRIELWVQNERDFFKASKLYSGLQARTSGRASGQTTSGRDETPERYIEVDEAQGRTGVAAGEPGRKAYPPRGELEQVSALLEQDIDEMLQRQRELDRSCTSLQCKLTESGEALARAQAALAHETESRAASESKLAAEISSLQGALERERTERARAQENQERESRELKQQLRSLEEAFKESQQKLDTKSHQLSLQQAAVVELRKEVVTREQQWEEQQKSLSQARAETVVEREARIAAEKRAEMTVAAQRTLEAQLANQQDLGQQVRDYAISLSSLRSKLQSMKASGSVRSDSVA